MDKVRIESLIKWWKETDTQGIDVEKHLTEPLMEAFGEDVTAIIEYLNTLEVDDLIVASSAFEDIYKKFMTDDVWKALGALEQRLKESNQI